MSTIKFLLREALNNLEQNKDISIANNIADSIISNLSSQQLSMLSNELNKIKNISIDENIFEEGKIDADTKFKNVLKGIGIDLGVSAIIIGAITAFIESKYGQQAHVTFNDMLKILPFISGILVKRVYSKVDKEYGKSKNEKEFDLGSKVNTVNK